MDAVNGLLGNPLTHIGLGLLGQGQSLAPGRVGVGRGVMQGLLTHSAHRQQQQLAEQRAQEMQMRQQQFEMQQQQFAQQQEQYRQAQMAAEQKQRFMNMALEGMPEKEQARARAFPDKWAVQQFAKPEKGTSVMQNALALGLQPGTPEYDSYVREVTMKPDVAITMPGTKPDRPLTAEERATFNIAEDEAPGYVISHDGSLKARPTSAETQSRLGMDAKKSQAAEQGGGLIADYREKAAAYQSGGALPGFGGKRAQANAARQALVAWYAKNILGTPGAEPTPVLYKQAEEIIPDFAGPYDNSVFDAKLAQVSASSAASLGEADTTSTSTVKKRVKFNPQTGKLE